MSDASHPEDHTARICVHTGAKAYACVGSADPDTVYGWYGSAVVDMQIMVAVDDTLPRGPICDEALLKAIADGRVYDPDPLLAGDVSLTQVPDRAILSLLRIGMGHAVKSLEGTGQGTQLGVPPVVNAEDDDPLGHGIVQPLFGRSRNGGPDLVAVGKFWVIMAKARGRPVDEGARAKGATEILARIRDNEDLFRSMLSSVDDALSTPTA